MPEPHLDQVSLIIPVYSSTPELLKMACDCLDSLRYGKPDEIIVVDDCSPVKFVWDGWLDKLIELPENGGYVKAINRGLAEASGDILIVGNSDLGFLPGWLEALVLPLQNGYDISTLRTTEPDGWDTEERLEDNPKFGSLFAITRSVYEKLGGFDERFKHYFGDTDYRRRAIGAGLRITKNHNGLVEHDGHKTFDETDPTNDHFAPDQRKFIEKHGLLE